MIKIKVGFNEDRHGMKRLRLRQRLYITLTYTHMHTHTRFCEHFTKSQPCSIKFNI